jgi:hypothetical protein
MSDAKGKKGTKKAQQREVLASLPDRRPQRVTARRAATRAQKDTPAEPTKTSARPARKAHSSATKPVARAPRVKLPALAEPAPTQGFESEEPLSGVAVDPPSGQEMAASALELGASLAQSTLAKGGRLVLGALGRLPRR